MGGWCWPEEQYTEINRNRAFPISVHKLVTMPSKLNMSPVICFFFTALFSSFTASHGAASIFTAWKPYSTLLRIPPVVDMRSGGSLNLYMGVYNNHSFGAGHIRKSTVYGYGTSLSSISYPGPTILTQKGTPISIHWRNQIPAPHILKDNIEQSLLMNVSMCYPKCGVPAIVHVHGLETPAEYDGQPIYAFGKGQSRKDYYNNSQPAATLVYHDHALGLSRLNIWMGLIGLYIIEDTQGIDASIRVGCDIPLLIQDKIVATDGSILYPKPDCPASSSLWTSEAYGTVNVVNGVVAPFVKIPKEQCRLRFINGANAREYSLNIPFADVCKIIAKDSAYVRQPKTLPKPFSYLGTAWETETAVSVNGTLLMYPFERIDLFCDFRKKMVGSSFNITNYDSDDGGAIEVFQVRVVASTTAEQSSSVIVPTTLNPIKDLRALWRSSGGKTRNITLIENTDDECPTNLRISADGQDKDFFKDEYIPCEIGKVEKWNFVNPTPDVHPFHWHLVHAQCGPSEETPNTNELRDVFPIPPSPGSNNITQVCYVACTPGNYLIANSTLAPTNFGFQLTGPYLVHCHIVEHEENMMMTWFYPKACLV